MEVPVIHMKDASQNALVAARLLNPESSSEFVERLNKEYAGTSSEKTVPNR